MSDRVLAQARLLKVEVIQDLEAAVKAEAPDTINLEVYVALLKLYQFHPSKANFQLSSMICMKALVLGLAENCFAACIYLIPEKAYDRKEMRDLLKLHDLLERSSFLEVWSNLTNYMDLATQALGLPPSFPLESSIRRHVLNVMGATHTSMPLETFLSISHYRTMEGALASPDVKAANIVFNAKLKVVEFPGGAAANIRASGASMTDIPRLPQMAFLMSAN